MLRFVPKPGLHLFEKQNIIPQKDRFGIYDVYKCAYCKLVCKRYLKSNKMAAVQGDKRITGCIERRLYPDRFRLWNWKCDYLYND